MYYRDWFYGDHAQIKVTEIPQAFNTRRYEYEWIGEQNTALINQGPHLPVRVPNKTGSQFWLGHLNLVVVDYYIPALTALVALADGRAYQMLYTRRVRNFLSMVKSRVILTACVWGLGTIDYGMEPQWSWIKRR